MTSFLARLAPLLALALAVTWAAPLRADGPPPAAPPAAAAPAVPAAAGDQAPAEGADGEARAQSPWRKGPDAIDLGHELTLELPAGHEFLGQPLASELMKRMGNLHNEDLLGIVTATGDDEGSWLVVVRYDDAGYVRDDEEVDADELLKAIKEGTEQDNEERVKQGFKALRVGNWAEPPRYDRSKHHLVWALTAEDDDGASVNYSTRVLGRRGYVALNLVTEPARLAADKPEAARLLAATRFKPGARYEDFDEKGGDKVAEYGLAGLVLGGAGLGAAKLIKLGLLAKFWNVIAAALLAGKKFVVLAVLAVAGFVKRFFGRKSDPAA